MWTLVLEGWICTNRIHIKLYIILFIKYRAWIGQNFVLSSWKCELFASATSPKLKCWCHLCISYLLCVASLHVLSPGDHLLNYYPVTLSSLSNQCNSLNQVSVDGTYWDLDLQMSCSGLTHWPWGIWLQSQIIKFQTHFNDKYLKYFLWNCYHVNATTPHWSLVNIGSGNGLVPSGNKPLPEPMLT